MVKLTKPVTIFYVKRTEKPVTRNGARVYGRLPEVNITIESEKIRTEEDMFRLFSPVYGDGDRSIFPHPIFQIMGAIQAHKTKAIIPWNKPKTAKKTYGIGKVCGGRARRRGDPAYGSRERFM